MDITSMQERNVLSGMLASWLTSFIEIVEPVKWFLLAALCLIIADAKFGIEAAKKRGEHIRRSRAIRRTVNKLIDYICWILVASSVGAAFGQPLGIPILPAIVLFVIYGCEINSCFNNYFEARGSKFRINIFKWIKTKPPILEPEEKKESQNIENQK